MKKAKEYGLNFKVRDVEGSLPFVDIECDRDSSGSIMNRNMADFIELWGAKSTQMFIDQLSSSDDIDGYKIQSNFGGFLAEFFSPPPRAAFWNGAGHDEIPLEDYLQILREWVDYLNSLPFKHWRSNQ